MKQKQKKRGRRGIGILIGAIVLVCSFPAHAEEVKISDKEYVVTLNDALNLYMSNEKPVSGDVGSKVFLTYTVEKVTKNAAKQSGIVGTMDHAAEYPYLKDGRMYFEDKTLLYEEGYTYVFRFERTEDGFEYRCARLKGEESVTLHFGNTTLAPDTEAYKYYGTWIGGALGDTVSAVLNHVRCYDENGNDLGIHFNGASGILQNDMNDMLNVHLPIGSTSSFSLKDTDTVLISNRYATQSDRVYMEYEVENITQDDTYQQGLMATNAPAKLYPHSEEEGQGYLYIQQYEKGQGETPLLREGGKYFICFSRKEGGFDGIVQCTVNGETETTTFSYGIGKYQETYPYFSIWLGEGPASGITADFKNFKCYDAEGNSLGVQLNRKEIQVSRQGELENYSKCEAVYYCKDNHGFIVLADDTKATVELEGVKSEGTYKILNGTQLYYVQDDGKEMYDYTYLQITDQDGHMYKRLKNSPVTFVTDEETTVVYAEAENGYRIQEPDKPVKEGNTFIGWYLGDDTAFDFDTVVTEGITLYAKWENGNGYKYLAADQPWYCDMNVPMLISIVTSCVLVGGSIVGSVVMIRRKKK